MEEYTNTDLINKIKELNELEINKSKIFAVIFQKTTKNLVDEKLKMLKESFEGQAKYYNQKLENYVDIYNSIIDKYEKQLNEVVAKYNELFINVYLELQETECNQKITITNLKKSYQNKQKFLNRNDIAKIDEYERKIFACAEKKNNYEIIIQECENELNICLKNFEQQLNSLFNYNMNLAVKESNGLSQFINKLRSKFNGKSNFNTYVIAPMNVELEMLENKLPDVINDLKQDTIRIVARIKQAKYETNKIFESMI